jgi:flagellar biosynthesis protein
MIDPERMAVALRYRPEAGRLPEVAAKGRGAVAAQIEAIARAHGIPVERDADLAQILHLLDVDSPIPTAAFAAVAEILAELYRTNVALAATGRGEVRS